MTKLELQQRLDALSTQNAELRAENSALRVQCDALRTERDALRTERDAEIAYTKFLIEG